LIGPEYAPLLDERDAPAFVAVLRALRSGYVPEWLPPERGADAAMLQIAAHYLQAIARRLNQAPDKNKLAFLELVGVRLVPAQPAKAPIVFVLADDAADVRLPAGTRLAAPPPPGGTAQISYETESSSGLAVAKLRGVFSLWPGRDQYRDHSEAVAKHEAFQLFHKVDLKNTPHELYIAHDRLLALAGQSAVTVTFELTTPSNEYLDIRWEYWDGKLWRGFLDTRPACDNAAASPLDSTSGLRASGAYQLRTDCAETGKRTVNGVDAYWVRGRLEEPLPPDPDRVLAEVESIRLSTTIARSYGSIWRISNAPNPSATQHALGTNVAPVDKVAVRVVDATAVPAPLISVSNRDAPRQKDSEDPPEETDSEGRISSLPIVPRQSNTLVIRLGSYEEEYVFTPAHNTRLEVTFTLDMLPFDKAVGGGTEIDLSQPFFPLGLQPQPGAAFYFSHEEAFSKPGARLRICVQPAITPELGLFTGAVDEEEVNHVISWDYWDGRAWVSLLTSRPQPADSEESRDFAQPANFRQLGMIELTVPNDLAPTTVADQEGLWMRARLVTGGYGFSKTVPITTGQAGADGGGSDTGSGGADGGGSGGADDSESTPTIKFFVAQPPALSDFRLGYSWQDGPHPPEHVLTFNDFRYDDRTDEAVWPGRTFQAFTPVADATPALYLGFDGKLPVDDLGLFFDVVEQRRENLGPTLVWEYWDGFDWRRLRVDDETRHFRVPGLVSFIGPEDSQQLARFDSFDTPRHWLRARLLEDGPPGEPTMRAVYANAVPAVQRQTITGEALGTSTGEPNQVFTFLQLPILPHPEIEVRELEGLRAAVEWRTVVAQIFDNPRVLLELETQLGENGVQTDVQYGPVRLVRDRSKRVTEVWVEWQERTTLLGSEPEDRGFVVDLAPGRIFLGDGDHGRVPPLGAAIVARRYRTGGGAAGNVAARAISQLLGPVGGVQEIFNPVPAEGGADGETAAPLLTRGPRAVRHRGRAVTPEDYAALAREASASVAVARALSGRDADGRPAPGWVTLVIIPRSAEPRPYPSFGLREQVRQFITARAAADMTGAEQIVVTGPDYQPVDVAASIVPRDPTEAGAVERDARAAIAGFLHPLSGGPSGRGWSPGEDVWLSDLAPLLERVPGVDHISEIALLRSGELLGEHVPVANDRIPVAGEIRLRLVGGE
jgi:uncharacterized phage protein gp47/JayE